MTRRVLVLGLAAWVLASAVAEAQEEVALRFYIVPKVFYSAPFPPGTPPVPHFGPKYFEELQRTTGTQWAGMDYGKEDSMLVGADVTSSQHTTLAANLDVTAIPVGLDSNVSSAALATVQDRLEGMKIPAGWVTTGHTYRQVVGTVGRIFQLMQRFDGIHRRTFFESGITLDTRINQLTAGQRDALAQTAASFGLDTSFVTGQMTVRQVLKTWVDLMPPFTLMGQTF